MRAVADGAVAPWGMFGLTVMPQVAEAYGLSEARAEAFFRERGYVIGKIYPDHVDFREPALDDVVEGHLHGAYVRDYVTEPIASAWRPPAPAPRRTWRAKPSPPPIL